MHGELGSGKLTLTCTITDNRIHDSIKSPLHGDRYVNRKGFWRGRYPFFAACGVELFVYINYKALINITVINVIYRY